MIILDGDPLGPAEIEAIALGAPIGLGASGRARAEAAHRLAVELALTRTVYGRTTGVGANKDTAVAPEEAAAHGRRLLRSHATSAGPLRSPERVRATMAIRLNQLCAGGSGARPEVLDALAALLGSGVVPPVREHVGVGTGDLGALATIALALPGGPLGAEDALPFLSSNAATLADAALACAQLERLATAGIAVAALTSAALDGSTEAYADAVTRAAPYDGVRLVAARLRSLLQADAVRPAARLQDPLALRCLPQVHGLALDELARLGSIITDGTAAAAENPVIDMAAGTLAHHGGFHAAYLAAALDAARLAVAGAAGLSLRRLALLIDPEVSGLAAFLGDGTAGASGVMGLEYAAGSALGDLRALATPASLQTLVLSRGVEDDASFASLAARQALAAVPLLAVVLGGELVAALRAVRLRGLEPPAGGWGLVARACADLDPEMADRDLTADLELAQSLLPRLVST